LNSKHYIHEKKDSRGYFTSVLRSLVDAFIFESFIFRRVRFFFCLSLWWLFVLWWGGRAGVWALWGVLGGQKTRN